MQVPAPKINLSVHLGEDQGQSLLARVVAQNYSGGPNVAHIKAKAKVTQSVGNALLCVIRYSVYPGREEEALKYLQLGFDESLSADLRSPIQFITRRHKDEDEVQSSLYTEPGAVCVRYKFKMEEQEPEFLAKLSQFHKLRVELILKGFVSHNVKNRTNVKVDYSYLNITGDEIDTEVLHGLLMEGEIIPEEVINNPFYTTLKKAKKLHLALKFKSFRQINKFYEEMKEAVGEKTSKDNKKEFRYQVPGLFREKAEAFAFFRDEVAVSADITHQGEEIFLRLIKVYFKAARKGLDI